MRLAEAKCLLAGSNPCGAYYLAGYAVECAIKACIAKQTQQGDFPDKKRANDAFEHGLDKLITVALLQDLLNQESKASQKFDNNWAIVKDWNVEKHYDAKWSFDMAAGTLVEYPIEAGRSLLSKLDKKNLSVTSMFWHWSLDTEEWILVVASLDVPDKGPRYVVEQVRAALDALTDTERDGLSLQNLRITSPFSLQVSAVQKQHGTVEQEEPLTGGLPTEAANPIFTDYYPHKKNEENHAAC